MKFEAKEREFATKMVAEIPPAIEDLEKARELLSKHDNFLFVKTVTNHIEGALNNLQSRLVYFQKTLDKFKEGL